MRIQSIEVASSLIIVLHFNIGAFSSSSVFLSAEASFHSSFCSFLTSLVFASIVATTFNQIHSQSRKTLSRINVINLVPFRFILYAGFLKWGKRISLVFVGRQNIYCDFPTRIPGSCRNRIVSEVMWHDQWGLFVKMSLRERIRCFAILLERFSSQIFFCYHRSTVFSYIVFPHFLQLPWNFIYIKQPLQLLVQQNPTSHHPHVLHLGRQFHAKNGFAALPNACAKARNPTPRSRPISLQNGFSTCLEATICRVFFVWLECCKVF